MLPTFALSLLAYKTCKEAVEAEKQHIKTVIAAQGDDVGQPALDSESSRMNDDFDDDDEEDDDGEGSRSATVPMMVVGVSTLGSVLFKGGSRC